jgi:hypothetical protein
VSFLRWVNLDSAVSIRDLLSGMETLPSSHPAPARTSAPNRTAMPNTKPVANRSINPADDKPRPAANANGASVASPKPEIIKPAGEPNLEDLQTRWGAILSALEKKQPAAAAQAEDGWSIDTLEGKKLTLCPSTQNEFVLKQMKEALPAFQQAIKEVTGWTLIVTTGKPKAAAVKAKPKTEGKSNAGSGGTLFNNVKNQFGAEEIPGDEIREPE